MPKPKRQNKSKQEVLSRIQNVEKAKGYRKFVREQFFPALCESTDSIQDADMFLQTFSTMIMENFLQIMKEKKFSDFNLVEKLSKDSPKHEAVSRMLHLFDDMSCREAQDMIDGMKDELRLFYRDEMRDRKLDTLKTRFLE